MRLFWIYFLIYEFQGRRVNAIAKTGGRRAVLENVAQVAVAAAAADLGAHHAGILVAAGRSGLSRRFRPRRTSPAHCAPAARRCKRRARNRTTRFQEGYPEWRRS